MTYSLRHHRWMVAMAAALATACCVCIRPYGDHIDQGLAFCRILLEPDAGKADGEAWFWFQAERAALSRRLWNPRGVAAIDSRLATTANEIDRRCLEQLRREAISHPLVHD